MQRLPTVQQNLKSYMNAGFPIIYIYTYEEAKTDKFILSAAGRREIVEWNGANGFVDFKTKASIHFSDNSLEGTLAFLSKGKELHRKLLVIKDAAEMLKQDGSHRSDKAIALLKEIARKIRNEDIDATVIIVSSTLNIPHELEKLVTVMELDLPNEAEILKIIDQLIEKYDISVPNNFLGELATAFKGMTESEIENLFGLVVASGAELTNNALNLIRDQKEQIIIKDGKLEMIPLKESIKDIGGLEVLKDWLGKKAKVFKNMQDAEKFGVSMPKGVMIAGVPGCGKSLSAKAAGSMFNVPLLRLDMGRLMGKYLGESEENMRRAIALAEAISPCILWVDELEKAFAGIGSGGGHEVTTRLFGSFLTWMQEKKSAVFVLATANDITELPPELLRKGRFDEIFYVGLPNPAERKKIFEIHLRKHKVDTNNIVIDKLVEETEGYCGADIEGIVNESVENAFVKEKNGLTTEDIVNCIHNTHSLSEIMKDKLEKMIQDYEDRKFKNASEENTSEKE